MRYFNLIIAFGLLTIITVTKALPLDTEEDVDTDVEDR